MSERREQALPVSMRRSELDKREPLTPSRERELSARFRLGDRDAGSQIIEACVPFVMTIALEYRRWGVPVEDLVQEGNIGLLKAAERFDPDRGCRLVTYAAYWIRAEIREFVARGYRIVRLGSSKSERRALRLYRRTNERDPDTLAAQSGLSRERVVALLPLLMSRDVSLDKVTLEGDAPLDRLASSMPSPEEEACRNDEQEQLSTALRRVVAELSPREQKIAETRWLSDEPRTLEALGADFGVSKERVRQIEERAKARVKARLTELLH